MERYSSFPFSSLLTTVVFQFIILQAVGKKNKANDGKYMYANHE